LQSLGLASSYDNRVRLTKLCNQRLTICDTGAQNPSYVAFGFLIQSYSTQHLLQNTFTETKNLVSN